jgi:hypothetical protein
MGGQPMITDKDKEDIIKAIHDAMMQDKYLMSNKQEREQYALFILENYTERIRTESADQARKDAAERVACAWREHGENITLRTIRDAILGDSTTDRIPDTGERLHPEITNDYVKKLEDDLSIAVKALEKISRKGKASSAFDSHFSRLQDSCAFANDALKEIQG